MRGPGPWRWPCQSAAGAGGVVCGQSRAHGHARSARTHLPSITGDQRPPLAQSPLPAQAPATRHIPEGLSLRPGWWIPQPLSPHRPFLPRVWAGVQRTALPSVSVFVRGSQPAPPTTGRTRPVPLSLDALICLHDPPLSHLHVKNSLYVTFVD